MCLEPDEMLDRLVIYLKEHNDAISEDDSRAIGETESAILARKWAERLLEASSAKGLGGCLLCQG